MIATLNENNESIVDDKNIVNENNESIVDDKNIVNENIHIVLIVKTVSYRTKSYLKVII